MGIVLVLAMYAAVVAPVVAGVSHAPADSVALPCRNGFYLMQDSNLLFLDENSGRQVTIARLPSTVDAAAYVAAKEIVAGLAYYGATSHIVTIDARGEMTDRGAAPKSLQGATAAASDGNRLLVHSDNELWAVDTSSFLVTAEVKLSAPVELGDWDFFPSDGSLYGVEAGPVARLVRINPVSGVVNEVASLPGLPPGGTFDATAIDADGNLHALHNDTGRMYHIPLAHPNTFTVTESGLSGKQADAAQCPAAWDFGDASESYNPPAGGPRHTITTVGTLSIGATVNAEPKAKVDDADDGIPSELSIDSASTSWSVTTVVSNTTGRPALLAGWHDFDHDGDFTIEELATNFVPADATTATLHWKEVTVGAFFDRTFLRLRLFGSSPKEVGPGGSAFGGEVEDHEIRIQRPIEAAPPAPTPPQPVFPHSVPQPEPLPPPSTRGPTKPPQDRAEAIPARRSPALPITLSVFLGMLTPAIVVAARSISRSRRRNRSRP